MFTHIFQSSIHIVHVKHRTRSENELFVFEKVECVYHDHIVPVDEIQIHIPNILRSTDIIREEKYKVGLIDHILEFVDV